MLASSVKRLAIVVALIVPCVQTGSSQSQSQSQSQPRRVIRISAERFAFTPSEIVVEAGEEVELRLKSDDTAHGFRIAGTTVNVAIPKRGRAEIAVPFRAPEPGRYTFECNRMCGAGHNFMRGELVVRERAGRVTGR